MTSFGILTLIFLVAVAVSILGMAISVILNRREFPGEVQDLSGERKVGKRFILGVSLWDIFTSTREGDFRYLPFALFFVSMYGFWFFLLLAVSESFYERSSVISVVMMVCALFVPFGAARQLLKSRAARSKLS